MPPLSIKLSRKAKSLLAAISAALVAAREASGVRRVDLLEKGLTQPLSRRIENDVSGVGVSAFVAYLEAIGRLDVLEAVIHALRSPKSQRKNTETSE
jgi:hypothetical protein